MATGEERQAEVRQKPGSMSSWNITAEQADPSKLPRPDLWLVLLWRLTELGLVAVRQLDQSAVLLVVEDLHPLHVPVHPWR